MRKKWNKSKIVISHWSLSIFKQRNCSIAICYLLFVICYLFLLSSCHSNSNQQSTITTSHSPIDVSSVIYPTDISVLSSVKTITAQYKEIPLEVNVDGYLSYDTRTYNTIASRYSGRIDKLYLKYAFQEINKGDKLFEIYSPEIYTEEQNLIYLLNNDSSATALIDAAKQKLLLLGLTKEQIGNVEKTRKADLHITVYSPYSGHLHEMENVERSEISMQSGEKKTELSIKEGMYVEKGQTIFLVTTTEKLWAILKIYNEDIRKIKLNQDVELFLEEYPSDTIKGEINFIEPFYENASQTMNVRVFLENEYHHLKAGTLLHAKIKTGNQQGYWIPRSASVDLGNTKIVFLKHKNLFKAHQIHIGQSNDSLFEVLEGLSSKDEIAVNAQYLMDSESFVKVISH